MSTSEWSVPTSAILDRVGDALDAGREAVLATIVDVEGNAYRRPGAKMLIEPGGESVGSITAGCLEDEVRQLARETLDDGGLRVETYDLMEDDDVWGLGVGCNGIITVALEPLDERYRPAVEALRRQEPVAALTALDAETPEVERGHRAHYRPGEGFDDADLPQDVTDAVEDAADRLAETGTADTVTVDTDGGTVSLFIDGIAPQPELVVIGSGHDVGPVVELGRRNGFRVTVVGFRGAVDLAERFPEATETVTTAPADLTETLSFDDDTYAVVMTHNFVDDRIAVEQLLSTPVPYVGLMGPRERFQELREALEADGTTLTESDRERLYTPVGLDLGGGSPYQIATSIVGEALAVHNERQPQHLTEREGPIHDRVDTDT